MFFYYNVLPAIKLLQPPRPRLRIVCRSNGYSYNEIQHNYFKTSILNCKSKFFIEIL